MHPLRAALLAALILGTAVHAACAAEADVPASPAQQASDSGLWPSVKSDIAAYFTAPVRWEAREWAWFAGAVAATGAAHHYDTDVRMHFIRTEGPTVGQNSHDAQDAAPTVAVFFGTWLYAGIIDSPAGRHEVWDMAVADQVQEALGALPEELRQPIQLAYFGGHTYREVARILNAPEGTVKSRIRSGLGRLRTSLAERGIQPAGAEP